jgi:homoserine dehydrogenase
MAINAIGLQGEGPGKRPPATARPESYTRVLKIAILGFGTVGNAVAKLLCSTPHLPLRLTHIFNRNVDRKRVSWISKPVEWTDDLDLVLASDVDVVVEVAGGLEPARHWVQRALLAGKSVVTANKHVMAVHGLELLKLAERTGQRILYGASVAGGIPVLNALEHGLAGDRLLKVTGVLNGTCNYILSNMESCGTALATALAKVQKLGFAEADPSDDLNGTDATCKLAIVARIGFQADIRPECIYRRSIEGIEPADFQYARQLGCTIRQISMAEIAGKRMLASVQPMLVPLSSPLSRTKDNQNAVVVCGEHGGETVFSGRGAGGGPTAVAIVSDLLALQGSVIAAQHTRQLQRYDVAGDFPWSYLIRLRPKAGINDKAMINIFLRHGIEVGSVLRKSDRFNSQSDLVILVKPCRASTIETALEEMSEFLEVKPLPVYLPIVPD